MDDIGVERIEDIGLISESLKINLPVPYRPGKAMPKGAVQHSKPMRRVFKCCKPEAAEVITQETESLHVLLKAARDGLDLAERLCIVESECPAQGSCERRFAVLASEHQERFLIPAYQCARLEESADVVDDEHLERLKQKRGAAQRPAGEILALLVAEKSLNRGDDEFRKLCLEIPYTGRTVVEVSGAGRADVLACGRASGRALRVLLHDLLMFGHGWPP